MSLAVAVLRERAEGERRVALDPISANKLVSKGFQVLIEKGAGEAAGFSDQQYSDCTLLDDAEIILTMTDVWLWVQVPVTEHLANLPDGSLGMGLVFAHRNPAIIETLNQHRLTCVAVELVPRINRTLSMDVLSSQATIAGYKAALRAATLAPRLFPMLTTAAGTLKPATVLVIGAGVAGMQAIATTRRLGAQVEVYDIHAAARKQVESLGAHMIDTAISSDEGQEDEGQKDQDQEDENQDHHEPTDAEIKQHQVDKLAEHLASADVVISTVTVADRQAPKIITAEMLEGMAQGAVIVDMAAESGGNCELTEPGATITSNGVVIDGPLNLASEAATHASELYAHNLLKLLELVLEDDTVNINREDEVIAAALLTHQGKLLQKTAADLPTGNIPDQPAEDQ